MHSDDKDQNLESGRRVQSEWDTQEISTLDKVFFNDTATTEIYTLSLHDALPIWIEPLPPALGARSLNHWTAREVPKYMNS